MKGVENIYHPLACYTYALHRAVLIFFIDCFYSCWKRERITWGWGGPLEVRPDVWWGRRHCWRGVWMDCVTYVLSQPGAHRALCHAAVEITGDSEVQGNAPQMSAKWTEFWQNAAIHLQLRGGKHTSWCCRIFIYMLIRAISPHTSWFVSVNMWHRWTRHSHERHELSLSTEN